ncbi:MULTISPECIES: solute:sodium symporter family transporter [unclassified Cellulophaga]|uniref:solute:sodium symporter family transporter n=1 Tax=unclassified Cellulophaga TaxID=2634405 RepID=UPI0026E1B775|nr:MULTISPECIES: solute:sodium symporter family transporter [unclassified Cellulophaga]MDO6492558.1 solute:sodium symporter family transporter [Cellulophaga sp. 2_MG-2023]MDO6493660.1 solute:sodium symporter family transporter [Cellulophaga sp. 3_MG-2023]
MDTLSIISFLGFTILVGFVAWYATRKTDESTADGYYLGGRSLGAITIAGSLLLTNLSAEQIVGLNGQSFAEGVLVMAWETLAAIAMIFTAIYLLPKYMRSGITTIPEFIQDRFDGQTKAILSILFLIAFGVVLLPTILYSGSLAFSTMFNLSETLNISQGAVIQLCVWSIGIIGIIYAIFGGLRAVAISDLVNAIGLLIGGLLIPIFGLMVIGDGSVTNGLDILWTSNPEKFNAKGSVTSSIPFGTIFTGMMIAQMYYWGTNQSILQRVFGAKSLKEGQKGMILAGFVKFLIPVIVVLPGIIAWHLFEGNLENADQAYPALVRKVLPGAYLGFFAAVLFGAILSSFNSLLNSSATLFGFDLYRQYFSKNASDSQTVRAGKIFGFFLAIVSILISPLIANAPDGLFAYIQESLGSLSVPILAVVTMGIVSKKVPAIGAKIVLIGGVIMYLVSQFVLSPYFVNKALKDAALFGITNTEQLAIIKAEAYPHFLHIMGILFVVNSIIMLIVAKIKPKQDEYIPKVTEEIDIVPWKYAKIIGLIITILVLSTYLIF